MDCCSQGFLISQQQQQKNVRYQQRSVSLTFLIPDKNFFLAMALSATIQDKAQH